MIQPPSIQREYSDFWSEDPALSQAPEMPPDDATEESKAAARDRLKEHQRKVERARETGNWSEIQIQSEHPTVFTLKPISGQALRAILSKVDRGELDFTTAAPLAFRAAIVKIESPTVEIKYEQHKEFGRIATVALTDYLDAIDLSIVTELGMRVFSRGTTGLSPKS